MTKIVLDANLFVSAILNSQGKPAKIFDLVNKQKVKLAISNEILSEIRTVLLYPKLQKLHKQTSKEIDILIKDFIVFAQFTRGLWKVTAVKDDPKDNKYLECALEARADFIVSGDHHLKDLKSFQDVKIVSPAEFIEIVAE